MSEWNGFTVFVRFCPYIVNTVIEVTPCHVHYYSGIMIFVIGEWGVDDTMSWYGVIMARKKRLLTKKPP